MARALFRSKNTHLSANDGTDRVHMEWGLGDCVGVFEDSHVFARREDKSVWISEGEAARVIPDGQKTSDQFERAKQTPENFPGGFIVADFPENSVASLKADFLEEDNAIDDDPPEIGGVKEAKEIPVRRRRKFFNLNLFKQSSDQRKFDVEQSMRITVDATARVSFTENKSDLDPAVKERAIKRRRQKLIDKIARGELTANDVVVEPKKRAQKRTP